MSNELQEHRRLLATQRVTFMINRYVVTAAEPDGSPGPVLAFAEQKRLKLKEEITFFTGPDKREVLFRLKARSVLDLGATYDVTESNGAQIGTMRKDFARSLLRSTWHLDQPGVGQATGEESNLFVALLRRVWGWLPFVDWIPFVWPYHFTFTIDGQPAFHVRKKIAFRDKYDVSIDDDRLDRRLVIAQTIALDALQSR